MSRRFRSTNLIYHLLFFFHAVSSLSLSCINGWCQYEIKKNVTVCLERNSNLVLCSSDSLFSKYEYGRLSGLCNQGLFLNVITVFKI